MIMRQSRNGRSSARGAATQSPPNLTSATSYAIPVNDALAVASQLKRS